MPDVKADGSAMSFGVSARDGKLLGASCFDPHPTSPTDDRTGVLLQYNVPYLSVFRTELSVGVRGSAERLTVDDINRNPGLARGCPRDADDLAHRTAYEVDGKGVTVYADPDEIVLFNDAYRLPTPKRGNNGDRDAAGKEVITADNDPGFEIVLDSDGRITEGGDRGGRDVPVRGHILQATGAANTAWLKAQYAKRGTLGFTLDVGQKLKDVTRDRYVDLDESVDLVAGGRRMLVNGRSDFKTDAGPCSRIYEPDGVTKKKVDQDHPITLADVCRDARTVLGVDGFGRTVFATLTGPRDLKGPFTGAHVDGDLLPPLADLLAKAGLIDAVNLDGGGSTTLLTDGTVQNGLADVSADKDTRVLRPVFDAVYAGKGGVPVLPVAGG
ncbi:phosphodiester glycosidase family protein [Kitasatospora sp. NPDC054939]